MYYPNIYSSKQTAPARGSISKIEEGDRGFTSRGEGWLLTTQWDNSKSCARGHRVDSHRVSFTTDIYRVRAFAKKYNIDISGDRDLMTKHEREVATVRAELKNAANADVRIVRTGPDTELAEYTITPITEKGRAAFAGLMGGVTEHADIATSATVARNWVPKWRDAFLEAGCTICR